MAAERGPGGPVRNTRAYGSRTALLHAIEIALLVIAIGALGWYAGVRILRVVQQTRDHRALDRAIAARARLEARPLSIPLTPGVIDATVPPAPDEVLGRLEIARLGLRVMVREGTDAETLQRAVGHVAGTALPGTPGNVALAGHRDTFFRTLKDVKVGDRIRVTTPDRRVTYVVRDTSVVAPTETSALAATVEPTLTLVTCHPFNYIGSAPNRFIVRAVANEQQIDRPARAAPAVPATASVAGFLPAGTPATTVGEVISDDSRSASKRLRPAGRKGKSSAPKSKKPSGETASKKHGFWRTLGRFLAGR